MRIGTTLALGLFALLETVALSEQSKRNECDPQVFCNDCVKKLSTDSGFNFLKSYPLNFEGKEKVEFSYVLTKGTDYLINLCADASLSFTLQDGARNTIVTNKMKGQVVSAITFQCSATGIYYLKYEPSGATTDCGGSALGFKR